MAAFLYARGLVAEDCATVDIVDCATKVNVSLQSLLDNLEQATDQTPETEIQSIFYEAGKIHFSHDLRWWFKVIYEILLRQQDGPRLGQFVALVSLDHVIQLLWGALNDVVMNNPFLSTKDQCS